MSAAGEPAEDEVERGLTTAELTELFRLRREGMTYCAIAAALGISARRASRIYRRVIMPGVSPEYAAAVRNGQIDLIEYFTVAGTATQGS